MFFIATKQATHQIDGFNISKSGSGENVKYDVWIERANGKGNLLIFTTQLEQEVRELQSAINKAIEYGETLFEV